MLQGTVSNISIVPNKGQYVLDVELLNDLTTTQQQKLQYKEEMKGTADIITEDITVLERVFRNFRKLAQRK